MLALRRVPPGDCRIWREHGRRLSRPDRLYRDEHCGPAAGNFPPDLKFIFCTLQFGEASSRVGFSLCKDLGAIFADGKMFPHSIQASGRGFSRAVRAQEHRASAPEREVVVQFGVSIHRLRDERLPKGPRFASESLDADTASGSVFPKLTHYRKRAC